MIRWPLASLLLVSSAVSASAGTTEETSKINGYAVLQSTGEGASKINGYSVLQSTSEGASKINGYAVLCCGAEDASKVNGYAVLQYNSTPTIVPCLIDGANAEHVGFTSPSSTTQISLATTNSNEPIFITFFMNSEQTTGPAPTITSITGGGLSFARRAQSGSLITNCYGANTCYIAMEVWEALAASPLADQSFSVTASTSLTGGQQASAIIGAFGIANVLHPSSPFDPNVSLPAVTNNFNATAANYTASPVSTSNGGDLILQFCGGSTDLDCSDAFPNAGWTGPTAAEGFINAFIDYNVASGVYYKIVSSTLSGATLAGPNAAATQNWINIGDAIECSAGSAALQFQTPIGYRGETMKVWH